MSVTGPTNLPVTLLGTSSPINLCDGLPLFPADPYVDLGVQYSGTFFDFKKKVVGQEFKAVAGYSINVGACGPSWATLMTLSGVYGSSDQPFTDEVDLVITNDSTQAGFVIGLEAGLTAELKVKLAFKTHEFNIAPLMDVIQVALEILQQALGLNFLASVDETLPHVGSAWGIFGAGGSFSQNNGVVSASPVFSIPINLWTLLVDLDDSTGLFAGTLVAANEILDFTKSSLVFGPLVGLGITSTITMQSITLDDQTFLIKSWDAPTNTAIATSGAAFIEPPSTITLGFQQVPSFTIELGITGQLTLVQYIHLGATYTTSLLQDLGINAVLGTFEQTIVADVGSATALKLYDIELV